MLCLLHPRFPEDAMRKELDVQKILDQSDADGFDEW